MEAIIIVSALSQLALRALDKYANAIVKKSPSENTSERTPSQNAKSRLSQPTKAEPNEEGSISFLEVRLEELRSRAKALNSPDTFVQYARISREANKVEKELNDRRECEGGTAAGLDMEGIAKLFSSTVGPSTTGLLNRRFRLLMLKLLVRVVVFLTLWFYFSWHRTSEGDSDKGYQIAVDCLSMRPFAFLLARKIPSCLEGDWACSAQPMECQIPFSFAFGMCNIVLAMIVKTFT